VILVEPVVQPDYTKSRDERAGDVGLTPANYKITRELLETKAKPDAVLLHSLPRMDEIPPDVDITRWSRYWQEAFNGVVMRMALLALVLGAME
jgi:aspartate carbamoyltransferase catalytic subunit